MKTREGLCLFVCLFVCVWKLDFEIVVGSLGQKGEVSVGNGTVSKSVQEKSQGRQMGRFELEG